MEEERKDREGEGRGIGIKVFSEFLRIVALCL
jgi:hypothetical protein